MDLECASAELQFPLSTEASTLKLPTEACQLRMDAEDKFVFFIAAQVFGTLSALKWVVRKRLKQGIRYHEAHAAPMDHSLAAPGKKR